MAVFIGFQFGMSLSGSEGQTTTDPFEVFQRGLWIVLCVLIGAGIVYRVCHIETPRHFRWLSTLLLIAWCGTSTWLFYETVLSR